MQEKEITTTNPEQEDKVVVVEEWERKVKKKKSQKRKSRCERNTSVGGLKREGAWFNNTNSPKMT